MHTDPDDIVTNCGRRVTAGRFRIPAAPAIERVILRIGSDHDYYQTVWASLTAEEALTLSRALAAEARAIHTRST